MRWKPHVTVAAVAEQSGRFLLVEEQADGRLVLNQPAGHLDDGESLTEAVIRETLEETGWRFQPDAIIGLYRWRHPHNAETFLRVTFRGRCLEHNPGQPLDEGIVRTVWLGRDEILQREATLRSPLVLRCIDDYLTGITYPLELLNELS